MSDADRINLNWKLRFTPTEDGKRFFRAWWEHEHSMLPPASCAYKLPCIEPVDEHDSSKWVMSAAKVIQVFGKAHAVSLHTLISMECEVLG